MKPLATLFWTLAGTILLSLPAFGAPGEMLDEKAPEAALEKGSLPPGPPLAQEMPEFAQWAVDYAYAGGEETKTEAAPARPIRSLVTKTGTILHEERNLERNLSDEVWFLGNDMVKRLPTSPELVAVHVLSQDVAFPELRWLTKETFQGFESQDGKKYLSFKWDEYSDTHVLIGTHYALVDPDTRYPILSRFRNETRRYTFLPPPEGDARPSHRLRGGGQGDERPDPAGDAPFRPALAVPRSRSLLAGLLVFLLPLLSQARAEDAPSPRWTTAGTTILDPTGKPIRLRGFNVCWWVPPTDRDAEDLQRLGVNCVRYMFGYQPKGTYDPAQLAEVEGQVRCFTRRGLWVIPVLYLFETPNPADPKIQFGPWNTPGMNREFLAMWTDLVARLKDDPHIAAWEPLNEPHDADPALVAAWYREIVPRFRQLDPCRPVVVEGANYSHAEDLTDAFRIDDPNVIYAFHFYDPYRYTTDLQSPPLDYPGPETGGRTELERLIAKAAAFRERNRVPVWCGEWGVKTGAPHYDRWVRDVAAVLEAGHFDWCVWAWARQPSDPRNASFDVNRDKPEAYRLFADLFASLVPLPR